MVGRLLTIGGSNGWFCRSRVGPRWLRVGSALSPRWQRRRFVTRDRSDASRGLPGLPGARGVGSRWHRVGIALAVCYSGVLPLPRWLALAPRWHRVGHRDGMAMGGGTAEMSHRGLKPNGTKAYQTHTRYIIQLGMGCVKQMRKTISVNY